MICIRIINKFAKISIHPLRLKIHNRGLRFVLQRQIKQKNMSVKSKGRKGGWLNVSRGRKKLTNVLKYPWRSRVASYTRNRDLRLRTFFCTDSPSSGVRQSETTASPPRGCFSTCEQQMYEQYQPHLRILVVVCRWFSFRFVRSMLVVRIRGQESNVRRHVAMEINAPSPDFLVEFNVCWLPACRHRNRCATLTAP